MSHHGQPTYERDTLHQWQCVEILVFRQDHLMLLQLQTRDI